MKITNFSSPKLAFGAANGIKDSTVLPDHPFRWDPKVAKRTAQITQNVIDRGWLYDVKTGIKKDVKQSSLYLIKKRIRILQRYASKLAVHLGIKK